MLARSLLSASPKRTQSLRNRSSRDVTRTGCFYVKSLWKGGVEMFRMFDSRSVGLGACLIILGAILTSSVWAQEPAAPATPAETEAKAAAEATPAAETPATT